MGLILYDKVHLDQTICPPSEMLDAGDAQRCSILSVLKNISPWLHLKGPFFLHFYFVLVFKTGYSFRVLFL